MRQSLSSLNFIIKSLSWIGALVFALSIIPSIIWTKRTFKGIDRLRASVNTISQGVYSARVELKNEGFEIDSLINDFNYMLTKTEDLMAELRTIGDNIAHDLKTPLTRILICSELTLAGEQSIASLQKALGDNAEECRHMLTIINTMLDIANISSGVKTLQESKFDFTEMVDNATALFTMIAEPQGITITKICETPTIWCRGDKAKLQQMVANLLDNAVKFSVPNSSIVITIQEKDNTLILNVADSGIGISQFEQKNIFKRFYRADNSRNTPGNGLGLSMVEAIVKAHHAEISFESEVGVGTSFCVKLPQ